MDYKKLVDKILISYCSYIEITLVVKDLIFYSVL